LKKGDRPIPAFLFPHQLPIRNLLARSVRGGSPREGTDLLEMDSGLEAAGLTERISGREEEAGATVFSGCVPWEDGRTGTVPTTVFCRSWAL